MTRHKFSGDNIIIIDILVWLSNNAIIMVLCHNEWLIAFNMVFKEVNISDILYRPELNYVSRHNNTIN